MMRFPFLLALSACILASPPAAQAQSADAVAGARVLNFDSGLRVVLARTPPRVPPQIHVASYAGVGAAHDVHPGEAHFMEHIVANSPPAEGLPPPLPEGTEVFLGNALTRHDHTSFPVSATPDALEIFVTTRLVRVGGRISRDPAVVERERARVLAELERTRQNSRYSAYKALAAFIRGAPASVVEETAWVTAATPEDLWARIAETYRPERGVLVVAGDINLDQTAALVWATARLLGLDPAAPPAPPLGLTPVPADGRELVLAQNPPADFSAAVAFAGPRSDDRLAFLVLDQLLMGGRAVTDGVASARRSDDAPLGRRLEETLGATGIYDGKEPAWGVPLLAEGDSALYAIAFQMGGPHTPATVRAAVVAGLTEIRAADMDDDAIETAGTALATYYDSALRATDGRVLADHLAGSGLEPEALNDLPRRLREVDPDSVRRLMDRLLASANPPVVVLVPAAG